MEKCKQLASLPFKGLKKFGRPLCVATLCCSLVVSFCLCVCLCVSMCVCVTGLLLMAALIVAHFSLTRQRSLV